MDVTITDVVKSFSDKREYRHIVLPNGVSALVVFDPEMAGDDDDDAGDDKGRESEGSEESGPDDSEGEDGDDDEEGGAATKKAAAAVTVNVGEILPASPRSHLHHHATTCRAFFPRTPPTPL